MCEPVMGGVALAITRLRDTGRRLALLMSGHDAGVPNSESQVAGPGLLDLAGISIDDLSRLDDSVVATVIRDLVRRRRCGAEDGERFSNWESAI
jgi:hypothetical protein